MFTVLVAFNNTQPARDALQYAVDLCQRIQTGYRLLVVYCVALNPKRMLPGIDRLEQALNAEIEAESEKEIAECQRYLQESLNGKVTYEFFAVEGEGETGPVFEKYVKEKHPEANLFVVGSRNNGALKRWALGSVSDYCLHHITLLLHIMLEHVVVAVVDSASTPSTTTAPTKPPRNQKGRLLNRNDLLDAGGSSSFGRAYFSLCQLHSIPVLTQVMTPALEAHNHLYLDVDRVRRDEEWEADKGSARWSTVNARWPGIERASDSRASYGQLTRLELSGLPLRESALALLAKGLFRNQVLQELSLARTEIGDSGLHMLAPAIRTIMHLCVLNLGACRLTERGAHILAALLKSLAVRRQADQWAWSLRLSPGDIQRLESGAVPSQAAPRPLKRLNLCRNSIGDAGCEALLDLVREEVGILALDLQMNGITDRSGMIACGVLSQNVEIVVLDLRNNPIDATLLCAVHQALAVNEKRRPSEHTHVPTSPRAARRAPMPGIISVAGSSPARDTNGSAPASSLAQSTRQQQQHLDMLIDLMESSLASFHAMLDQMDRREEEHWRRKQERRTHRRTHEKQAT
nr:Centrosomal protein of 78 kDa [Polyrhizophydium stewartii]